MKIKLFSITLMLIFLGSAISAFAYPFGYGLNEIEIKSREALFRLNSTNNRYEEVDFSGGVIPGIGVGDIFVGVSRVQGINTINGVEYSPSAGLSDLTGVFVQEVKEVLTPANFGETVTTPGGDELAFGEAFISLGASTVKEFWADDGTSVNSFTVDMSGDEQFAFYLDENPQNSDLGNIGGPIASDVAIVEDGNLFMTAGFSYGLDFDADGSIYNDGDDTGYAWTKTRINVPLGQFTGGISFMGMNIIQNNTGWPVFLPLIDADEDEAITWMANPGVDIYLNADLDRNPFYEDASGNRTLQSPFLVDDPAWVNVVPEPGTMFLFGVGLLGFSAFARRKTS